MQLEIPEFVAVLFAAMYTVLLGVGAVIAGLVLLDALVLP